jgi:hypothetical protein
MSENNIYIHNLRKSLGNLKNWEYVGGNRHVTDEERFAMICPNEAAPGFTNTCPCGKTPILYNCYIRHKNTGKIKVVGSECINKFIPDGLKLKCIECDKLHLSRKYPLCAECKKGMLSCERCEWCGDWVVKRTHNRNSHPIQVCPEEPKKCKYCGQMVQKSKRDSHNDKCMIDCKYCNKQISVNNIIKKCVRCKICGGYYSHLNEHIGECDPTINILHRHEIGKYQCDICDIMIRKDDRMYHYTRCDNICKYCNQQIFNSKSTHQLNDCNGKCKYCNDMIIYGTIHNHEKQCVEYPINCMKCNKNIPRSKFTNHGCGEFISSCEECCFTGMNDNIKTHKCYGPILNRTIWSGDYCGKSLMQIIGIDYKYSIDRVNDQAKSQKEYEGLDAHIEKYIKTK